MKTIGTKAAHGNQQQNVTNQNLKYNIQIANLPSPDHFHHFAYNSVVQVQRCSGLYESAPAYVTDQPAFLNAAVLATTSLQPRSLLSTLKDIEVAAGRDVVAGPRWGPRPLDLDIIFMSGQPYKDDILQIPHPRYAATDCSCWFQGYLPRDALSVCTLCWQPSSSALRYHYQVAAKPINEPTYVKKWKQTLQTLFLLCNGNDTAGGGTHVQRASSCRAYVQQYPMYRKAFYHTLHA
jgi:2-amino-4-hydroxy-6-hydroxymethyldihydropteridine diphosphokinase